MNKNLVVKLLLGAIVVNAILAISFTNLPPNHTTNAHAGGACGFAIASGLGLISLAMLYREQ